MKGKSGIKDAVFQWAYQNRRQKTKTSEVLRSIEEVEKTLHSVKVKRKYKKWNCCLKHYSEIFIHF